MATLTVRQARLRRHKRVRHKVENTRVGKLTNYERLILEIWTNGTISPEEALTEASKILRKHLNPFIQYAEPGPEIGIEDDRGFGSRRGCRPFHGQPPRRTC